jgi:CO/xanthine dehydrogenase Mo-binding subunit
VSLEVPVSDPSAAGPAGRFAVVGHSVDRQDWREKVTGSGQYVADVHLPGALVGRVLRSPFPHARIARIDTGAARALAGVHAVLTGRDTPGIKWGEFRKDLYILAIDKVRYIGEEVAAVAAEDEQIAEEALSLIDVEYEELPALFDAEAAMLPGAPLIHEDLPRNTVSSFKVVRGDPDAGFARAEVIVEDSFQTRVQWHASLEPTSALAQVDPAGVLTIWMNANGVAPMQAHIAGALRLPPRRVRVIQPLVGGSFGGRGHDNQPFICGLLALATHGRPVQMINSREEDFLATRPRQPMQVWMRIGVMRDGTIVAKDTRVVANNGAYSTLGPSVARTAALRHDHMYLNENVRTELQVVHTNQVPRGAFRGFGNPSGQWAMNQMIDELARALDLDPRDVLMRNLAEAGHISVHGARMLSCEVKECLRQVAQLIDWDRKRANRQPNRGLGIAVSCMVSGRRSHGDHDGSTTVISLELDGQLTVRSGEGETGPGTRTVIAQIAAEALGARYDDVRVPPADTTDSPFGFGAHGSRATYIAGNATREAAQRARHEILALAGELLEVAPEDLDLRDSVVSVRGAGGERSLTLADVAHHGLFRRNGRAITVTATWDPPSSLANKDQYSNESGSYNFSAGALEVEVDPRTGEFRILDAAMALDGGTVIHPVACAGQNEGAFAQGLGYATTEDLVVEDGRPLNPNLSDYRIPCIADMPPFRQVFVPSYEPTGPFGAKGVSQVGLDTVAPALANAIFDAVGVRITSLPITPEKVFWALRNNERRAGDVART